MSTRCMIYFEGKIFTKKFYEHYDGYPQGIGQAIMNCKRKTPRLVQKSIATHLSIHHKMEDEGVVSTEEMNKMFEIEKRFDNTDIDRHMDIEWRYRIQRDGSVKMDDVNRSETYHIKSTDEFEALFLRVIE